MSRVYQEETNSERQLCRQNCLLSFPHQLKRLDLHRPCDSDVLGDIEPPFLGLVFRYECLAPADAGRELDLRDTGGDVIRQAKDSISFFERLNSALDA